MMEKSGGWGECGVFIRSKASYHRIIGVGDIASLVIPVCNKYNVKPPTFEIRPHKRCQWGFCYYQRKLIALNLPLKVGVLYHELAHHISFQLYNRAGKGHGYMFKRILDEILRDNGI